MIDHMQSSLPGVFRTVAFSAFFLLNAAASAQLEVNSTLTPDEYVNDVLLGTGVEATNVQFTGSPVQIGEITGFDPTEFPIQAGLILSTEVANNPANIDDGCIDDFIEDGLEVSGDADLLNIANSVRRFWRGLMPSMTRGLRSIGSIRMAKKWVDRCFGVE